MQSTLQTVITKVLVTKMIMDEVAKLQMVLNPKDRDYMYELVELYPVMSLSSVFKIQVRGLVSSDDDFFADVPIHRHVRTWSWV